MYGILFDIHFTWLFSNNKRPTRVSSNSKTLIDNVWTKNIGAVKSSGVILSSISDHFPVFVNHYLTNELLYTHEPTNNEIGREQATTFPVYYNLR